MKEVIGIIGPISAGKDEAGEYLGKQMDAPVYQISSPLREICNERGMATDRDNLINLGAELANKHGDAFLARHIIENSTEPRIIITGMRQLGQIALLNSETRFFLLSIDAPAETRFNRSLKNPKPGEAKNLTEFKNKEVVENSPPNPQRLFECMSLANHEIINDNGLHYLYKKLDESINIIEDYFQKNKEVEKNTQKAKDDLMKLGEIYDLFSNVKRVPRYSNGERESDTGHSFHLALSACEIAAEYYPELDNGLVAQFSLVHDLVEVYANDTPTFNITDKDRLLKEQTEKEALEKLIKNLPKHTAKLLMRYEKQIEPEARFVRYIDKIMPGVINILNKNVATFLEDSNVNSLERFDNAIKSNQKRLEGIFPELPFVSDLMRLVEDDLRGKFLNLLEQTPATAPQKTLK